MILLYKTVLIVMQLAQLQYHRGTIKCTVIWSCATYVSCVLCMHDSLRMFKLAIVALLQQHCNNFCVSATHEAQRMRSKRFAGSNLVTGDWFFLDLQFNPRTSKGVKYPPDHYLCCNSRTVKLMRCSLATFPENNWITKWYLSSSFRRTGSSNIAAPNRKLRKCQFPS